MKICIFALNDAQGGASTDYQRMITALLKSPESENIRIDLVMLNRVPNTEKEAWFKSPPESVNIIDFKGKNGKIDTATHIARFAHYIQTNSPDIIVSTLLYVNMIAVMARTLVPSYKRNTPIIAREIVSLEHHRNNPYFSMIIPHVYQNVNAVVALGEAHKRQIMKLASVSVRCGTCNPTTCF